MASSMVGIRCERRDSSLFNVLSSSDLSLSCSKDCRSAGTDALLRAESGAVLLSTEVSSCCVIPKHNQVKREVSRTAETRYESVFVRRTF